MPTLAALKRLVLERVDVARKFVEFGVRLAGSAPNAKRWIECYREPGDAHPSGGINIQSGILHSYGGSNGEATTTLWDQGAACGRYRDWRECLLALADEAGIDTVPYRQQKWPPAWFERTRAKPIEAKVARLVAAKPGITVDAVRQSGAVCAQRRDGQHVIRLPRIPPGRS